MSSDRLNVIALISGGKDSFFSLLHCLQNGHRVVALANLFPETADGASQGFQAIDPAGSLGSSAQAGGEDVSGDLNSFMYQTVGHEIIPLYASATGLPLYRQPITGGSVRHERDYDCGPAETASDETESMVPLLKGVMQRHPEANALCAGAILSMYQRTRVESVALRLGLTPLAYLWKYPILPFPGQADDDALLLKHMAKSGLEARIIKVASAGLDEDDLWHRVTSNEGAEQVKRALRKFGAAGGAVLGEGGEFETIVVDGPSALFKKRIAVPETSKKVVREGGGSTWLLLRGAGLEDKPEDQSEVTVSKPDLFEARFQAVLADISDSSKLEAWAQENCPSQHKSSSLLGNAPKLPSEDAQLLHWHVVGSHHGADGELPIDAETAQVIDVIRQRLVAHNLDAGQISNTIVVIRRMSDFPRVNAVYAKLFTKPNPPARVTISCGDLLPHGSNIAVYLSISSAQPELADRQGLHVQSRSYWAPANIGPYSQAVGIRVTAQGESTSLRTWSVAGQIPLIPSSMALPTDGPLSSQIQVALSLQHLWRIALDLKIQFWTSAVAFFCAQQDHSNSKMMANSKLAGLAWKVAHGSPDDDDDETESGPDPWDLKYNPQFMSLGGEQAQNAKPHLPDWEVLTLRQQNEPEASIPPCFAVEVEELPRQSLVEWHAHVGLAQVVEGTVETISLGKSEISTSWQTWHTVVKTSGSAFLHTVVARDLPASGELLAYASFDQELAAVYEESLRRLRIDKSSGTSESPYLTYMDVGAIEAPWNGASNSLQHPLIPCRTVWSSKGNRLGAISLYRTVVST